MIKTYKYRLKDRSAKKALQRHAIACNQVWNWCVAQHRDNLARYRAGAPKRAWLTHFDLAKQCNGVGKDLEITQQTVGAVCQQWSRSRSLRYRSSFGLKRAFIAVGDVNAKALAKTRMAKSVLDAGWSSFRAMLAYKARVYVEVDESFTTQTCSSCGALPPERPGGIAGLGIRAWDCSACGASHDRDVNAALNILALGRSVAPPVEESRKSPLKRQPDRRDPGADGTRLTKAQIA